MNKSIVDLANGFMILKPGFEYRKDDVERYLMTNGWSIIKKKEEYIDVYKAEELYKMYEFEDFFQDLVAYMTSGKCTIYLLYKSSYAPIKELTALKEIIRRDYSLDKMKNVVHCSDSAENVQREAKLFF